MRCGNGHTFDIAREGYVNLLPARGKTSRAPGDSRSMVAARARFHAHGHYSHLAAHLADLIEEAAPSSTSDKRLALDIGCGDGYMTRAIAAQMPTLGLDISKQAIRHAARQRPHSPPPLPPPAPSCIYVVASSFAIPVADDTAALTFAVMAPFDAAELLRVMEPGGTLVRVSAGPRHLLEAKSWIYDEVREHRRAPMQLDGFQLAATELIERTIDVDQAIRRDLIAMTPMFFRSQPARQDEFVADGPTSLTTAFHIDRFVNRSVVALPPTQASA